MTVRLNAIHQGQLVKAADPFSYPAGEVHLKNIVDFDGPVTYVAEVRGTDANDLMTASLLAQIARSKNVPFCLQLPYLPAARSDRGEPMGLLAYAEMINAMLPEQVIVIDVHSNEAVKQVHYLTELSATPLIERALGVHHQKYDALICPDEGAKGRTQLTAKELGFQDIYYASKKRDFETGHITGIEFTAEKPPASGRYLVVDDICDGGGTFMGLAAASGLPREQLGLWVTHGVFSGHAVKLRECYEHILTTDSYPSTGTPVATTIVPVSEYLFQATTKGV